MALRRQSQEVRHGLAADTAADRHTKKYAFLEGNQAHVQTCCSTANRNEPPCRPAQVKNRQVVVVVVFFSRLGKTAN